MAKLLIVMVSALASASAFAFLGLFGGDEPSAYVVKGGKAQAEIVIPERANEMERYAAGEVSRWVGEITGVYVPVVLPAQTNAARKVRLWVGRDWAKKLFPNDFKAFGNRDGYALRTIVTNGVRNVYLFAQCEPGLLHAAYQFIYRNSDVIWLRPDPVVGTVFGKSDDFPAQADVLDVPKSTVRHYNWNYYGADECDNLWESRNFLNCAGKTGDRFGTQCTVGGCGHGIQRYTNPKVNVAKHPDWYPLVKGKRAAWSGQICFTADDMIPEYVSNIVAEVARTHPGKSPREVRIDRFTISPADNWTCCECERCMKPFVCENKKVIDPTNAVFRSAQHYAFVNKVARELRKHCPQVKLLTLAYEFTLPVPPFPLEPNVVVGYCPYGLNEKQPMTDISNESWGKLLDEWCSVCRNVVIYRYFGWANTFPRSVEYPVQADGLHFLGLKYPVLQHESEHSVDRFCEPFRQSTQVWDVSGMSAWLVCRLWWDPTQDLEALRTDYCRRAYREAWEPMKRYHDLIRDLFRADRLPSFYNSGDPLAYTQQYIMNPGRDRELLATLEEALGRARHPVSKELIRRQLAHVSGWIAKTSAGRPPSMTVPCCTAADKPFEIASPAWEKAGDTGDLVIANKEAGKKGSKARFRSKAKLLHDGENFYVRFECWTPDMAKLEPYARSENGVERCPHGDIMEFYFGSADTGKYYMWLMDSCHPGHPEKDNILDACGYDDAWDSHIEYVVKHEPDRWILLVKVPFSDIGVNAVQTGKLLFQAIRQKDCVLGKKEDGKPLRGDEGASWGGGWVHQLHTFGELHLELKK